MKITSEEFNQLQDFLSQKTTWTTDEVHALISSEFGVEYTPKLIYLCAKENHENSVNELIPWLT